MGHVASLTEHYPLKAKVGETVRLFFGVGGPNFTSSFHVIGEIFDRAYQLGSVTQALRYTPIIQSISVPPGLGQHCRVQARGARSGFRSGGPRACAYGARIGWNAARGRATQSRNLRWQG